MASKPAALLALLLVSLSLTSCASTPSTGSATAAAPEVVHTATETDASYLKTKAPILADRVTLLVNGLSCPLCASNVDKQLGAVPGVSDVSVDFAAGTIGLSLSDPRPSPMTLARAIDRAGFTLVRIVPE